MIRVIIESEEAMRTVRLASPSATNEAVDGGPASAEQTASPQVTGHTGHEIDAGPVPGELVALLGASPGSARNESVADLDGDAYREE